jgi:Subtilase family
MLRENRPQAAKTVLCLLVALVCLCPANIHAQLPAQGSVVTQGDSILKADHVRARYGVNGKNVRVGVLGTGLAGLFATNCTACSGVSGGPMATGDLPSATGTRNANGILTSANGGIVARSFRADGDLEAGLSGPGNDGPALMEIVHDLAPDATFYFANFQTDAEFIAALNWLAANTDIVVNDVSFFVPPFDGTNAVDTAAATALNTDANPIRALITSVGNEAKSHYAGSFSDSGIDSASAVSTTVPGYSGDFHRFAATAATTDVCGLGSGTRDPVFVKGGGELNVVLTWDDSFASPRNDYDLWLFDGSGKVVAYSTQVQNGAAGQSPLEFVDFVNTGADAFFYIAITNAHNAAAAKQLNLFIRGADAIAPHAAALSPAASCPAGAAELHNYNTRAGSVPAMADAAAGVISVGAAPATNTASIEPFSTQGPTLDGRTKPDVVAVDGVNVTGAGGFGNSFSGTAAAAPHVAGVAALLMQLSPCLASGAAGARAPTDARKVLYDSLTKSAVDQGAAGVDNTYGFGLVDALAAAGRLVPTASITGTLTVPASSSAGAIVALDGSGSVDPASCPLAYSWSGDCGNGVGAKPSLNCGIGKHNLTLTVSNNGGVTKTSASTTITVTDFALNVDRTTATVTPGTPANYSISVTPQGGAYGKKVVLSCTTSAPESVCSLSPDSLTPGSAGMNAAVTVTTTAANTAALRPGSVPLQAASSLGFIIFGVFGGLFFEQRRRLWLTVLSTLLLLGSLLMFAACGALISSSNGGNSGTPTGTYNVVVSGTAGALTHSTTVTLVVQ